MLEWLFGDGGKALKKQRQQLDEVKSNQDYNRFMGNAMANIIKDPANAKLVSDAGSDFINDWTNQGNSLRATANRAQSGIDDLNTAYNKAKDKARYDYLGNGMLGAIVNPVVQTATAIGDLAQGTYDKNRRDPVSDVGAGVGTAMQLIPGISGAKALTGAGKISRAGLVKNALAGGVSSVAGAYREGGQDTNLADALGRIPMGAAMGALMPLGIDKVAPFAKSIPSRLQGLKDAGWRNYLPKSMPGRIALGGGALYAGSKFLPLLSGGGQNQYQDEDEGGYY